MPNKSDEVDDLARRIATALRESMSIPGYGYIDFVYRPPHQGEEDIVELAEEIASRMPPARITEVWAVIYSNYDPPEVHSLRPTAADAQTECDRLNREANTGVWRVSKWKVVALDAE